MVGVAEELLNAVIRRRRCERLRWRILAVGPAIALSIAVLPGRTVDVRGLEVAVDVVFVHLDGVRVGSTLNDRLVRLHTILYRLNDPTNVKR